MSAELIVAIMGGIAIAIGILAGIVQIIQYMQEKRLSLRAIFRRLFKRSAKSRSSPPPKLHYPRLSPDSEIYKFYSPAIGQVSRLIIVMPSRPRPPLEGRLEYTNRPFQYDFAPDDVYTMATIMLHLVEIYGTDYFASSSPFVTSEEIGTIHFRPCTIIAIGGGVSNEVSKEFLADKRLIYKMIGYDIYRGTAPFRIPKLVDGALTEDYGLISKYISSTNQVIMTLAGSHTFGQLAIALALSDSNFYEHIAKRTSLDQFQVVIQANIQERWVRDYDIIDIVHL